MRARLTVVLIGSMLVAAVQSWVGDGSEVSSGFVPASVEATVVTGSVDWKATLYIPVASYNRKDGICRRAAAYTKVGARSTFICPEFSRISDERAAMFVIHEALHHAGLTENPQDRRGMTSLAINSMVGRSCGF